MTVSPTDENKEVEVSEETSILPTEHEEPGTSAGKDKDETKEPIKLEDVLKDVVKPKEVPATEEKPSASSTEKKGSDDSKATVTPTADEDVKEGDDKLPFHNHPRWKERGEKLRNALKETGELKATVEALGPRAKYADDFNKLIRDNGLTPDNVVELMSVGILLRQKPAEARLVLQTIIDDLDEVLGEKLPDDLKKRVDEGEISEADAKELSKARAEAKRSKSEAEDARKTVTQVKTEVSDTQRIEKVRVAVQAEETRLKASDPDYALKKDLMSDYVKVVMSERGNKPAANGEEGASILREAHKRATAQFAKLKPEPKPRVASPSSGTNGRETKSAQTQPTDLSAVLKAAAAQANKTGQESN